MSGVGLDQAHRLLQWAHKDATHPTITKANQAITCILASACVRSWQLFQIAADIDGIGHGRHQRTRPAQMYLRSG